METLTKKIVIPVDGSKNALKSLDYLELIYGQKHNMDVHLFYVLPPLPPILTDEEIKDKKRSAGICILAIIALGYYGAGNAMTSPEAAQWAQKLDKHAEDDTIERAYADCHLGVAEYSKNTPENMVKGISLVEKSLDLSRHLGDVDAFCWITGGWMFLVTDPQRLKERYDLAEEAFKLHEKLKFSAAWSA